MASSCPFHVRCLWGLLVVAVLSVPGFAQEGEEEEVKIQDNSFLVEEAYNQDQGVVQHIFNWVPSWERDKGRANNFDFVFTQEWPIFSQQHQFSYTLPIRSIFDESSAPAQKVQGLGDVMLNYRYQLLKGEWGGWWAAPRFSLIFPTGEENAGLGRGQVGYQVNLPFSREFERSAVHFNAGATHTPGVTAGIDPLLSPVLGRDLRGYNLGASYIYFLRPNFHLMLENVALWDEALNADASRDHTFQYILSPGCRWAVYTHEDTQWVVGASLPVGLTRDAPDLAAFFYMSFEHRIQPKRDE